MKYANVNCEPMCAACIRADEIEVLAEEWWDDTDTRCGTCGATTTTYRLYSADGTPYGEFETRSPIEAWCYLMVEAGYPVEYLPETDGWCCFHGNDADRRAIVGTPDDWTIVEATWAAHD